MSKMETVRRSIEETVGFRAWRASTATEWNSFALYEWDGSFEECQLDPSESAALVLQVAGPSMLLAIPGRHAGRPSTPGLLTFVPQGHAVRCQAPGRLHSISVHFDFDRFGRLQAQRDGAPPPRLAFYDELLTGAVRALAEEVVDPSGAGGLYIESLLCAIVLQITHGRTLEGDTRLDPPRIALCKELIESALSTGISLSELSEATGLSQSHFCRMFRNATGITPHKYLMQRRIVRARSLLEGTAQSIARVALSCGFSSQAHFTTCFRSATGLTPFSYRRNAIPHRQ